MAQDTAKIMGAPLLCSLCLALTLKQFFELRDPRHRAFEVETANLDPR